MSTPGLTTSSRSSGSELRFSVAGELDIATEEELTGAVGEVLAERRPSRLVLDLAALSFIDSSGLRALLRCQQLAEQSEVELLLAVGDGAVRRLLDIAGIASWFSYA